MADAVVNLKTIRAQQSAAPDGNSAALLRR